MTYLQNLASQIKGLNLAAVAGPHDRPDADLDVNADGKAALAAGATGTPTVFVTGPGTSQPLMDQEAVPSLAGHVAGPAGHLIVAAHGVAASSDA